MKLQVFAASAHRKWNYSLWEHYYIPASFTFAVFANSYTSKDLLILPPSRSFSINFMYFADIPNWQLL